MWIIATISMYIFKKRHSYFVQYLLRPNGSISVRNSNDIYVQNRNETSLFCKIYSFCIRVWPHDNMSVSISMSVSNSSNFYIKNLNEIFIFCIIFSLSIRMRPYSDVNMSNSDNFHTKINMFIAISTHFFKWIDFYQLSKNFR